MGGRVQGPKAPKQRFSDGVWNLGTDRTCLISCTSIEQLHCCDLTQHCVGTHQVVHL